jgi:molybdopterin molybdotransferase
VVISAEQAQALVLKNTPRLPAEPVLLERAAGRVLAKEVRTGRSVPPYNRVMMDGIAIRFAAWAAGQRSFVIEFEQPAGRPPGELRGINSAAEVMTGAVLPKRTDCVVPYEQIVISNGRATIKSKIVLRPFQCIHPKGSDARKGKVILEKGITLGAPDIAAAASIGADRLEVRRLPRVMILATGSELVAPGKTVSGHEIYLSNPYGLISALSAYGFDRAGFIHCRDDRREIARSFQKAVKACDVVIFSGGVSKGKTDYVKDVLEEQNVKRVFYRVNQRPGKPLWFGKTRTAQLVFALPGNPVSALACFYHYVLPALYAMTGRTFKRVRTVCSENIKSPSAGCAHFIPARADDKAGGYGLATSGFANSGDFLALSEADGFLCIPEGREVIKKGAALEFTPWSPLWFSDRICRHSGNKHSSGLSSRIQPRL